MEPLTAASVAAHDGVAGRALWAVIDGHVLDVSQFAAVHPGGAGKIQEQPNRDCSAQFRVHFGATVAELRAAFAPCGPVRAAWEAQPPDEAGRRPALRHVFGRSRANGGLDRDGAPVGAAPPAGEPVGALTILGRLAQ